MSFNDNRLTQEQIVQLHKDLCTEEKLSTVKKRFEAYSDSDTKTTTLLSEYPDELMNELKSQNEGGDVALASDIALNKVLAKHPQEKSLREWIQQFDELLTTINQVEEKRAESDPTLLLSPFDFKKIREEFIEFAKIQIRPHETERANEFIIFAGFLYNLRFLLSQSDDFLRRRRIKIEVYDSIEFKKNSDLATCWNFWTKMPREKKNEIIRQTESGPFEYNEGLFLKNYSKFLADSSSSATKLGAAMDNQKPKPLEKIKSDRGKDIESEENVFCFDEEHWIIKFEGNSLPPLNDLKGFYYIQYLLKNRGYPISPVDMEQAYDSSKPDSRSTDIEKMREEELTKQNLKIERWDEKLKYTKKLGGFRTTEDIERRIDQLGRLQDRADEDGEVFEKERIEREINTLYKILDENPSAVLQKGRVRNSRTNVYKAINRAQSKITEHDSRLYAHLRSYIKSRSACIYNPPKDFPNFRTF